MQSKQRTIHESNWQLIILTRVSSVYEKEQRQGNGCQRIRGRDRECEQTFGGDAALKKDERKAGPQPGKGERRNASGQGIEEI